MSFRNSTIAWEARRLRAAISSNYRLYENLEFGFYHRLLHGHPGCILDVGANRGYKTEIFQHLATHVVAIEPDEEMVRLLKRRFRFRNVSVLKTAVGKSSGSLPFHTFSGNEAFNTADLNWATSLRSSSNNRMNLSLPAPKLISVPVTTINDLEHRYRPIKYLKIDIEGLEYAAISTLAHTIPLISLEFNLPIFLEELEASVEKLVSLNPRFKFNVALGEPCTSFAWQSWLTGSEAISSIRTNGWEYVEVFARPD